MVNTQVGQCVTGTACFSNVIGVVVAAAVVPAGLKIHESINQIPAQCCFGYCTAGATSIHGTCLHTAPTQCRQGKKRPIWKQQQKHYGQIFRLDGSTNTFQDDMDYPCRVLHSNASVLGASAGFAIHSAEYTPTQGRCNPPLLGKARVDEKLDGHTNEKPGWRVSTSVHMLLILLLPLNPSTFGILAMYHQKLRGVNSEEMN